MDHGAITQLSSSPRWPFLYRLAGVTGAGAAGWVVDVAVLWVTYNLLGVPAVAAAAAGFLAAGLTNFVLNRIVFSGRGGRTPRHAWRYGVLFGANLPVVALAVPLAADLVHRLAPPVPAPLVLGKVLVTALLLPLNAWLYGAWVFKD